MSSTVRSLLLLGFLAAAPANADPFAYQWLDRCLLAAEAEARPSGAANECMRDAVRVCEFSADQIQCLSRVAASSDQAANEIVSGLPQTLPEDRAGSGFYEKRRAKVADPAPLLVCNAPLGSPQGHCEAVTAMWRFSSARALARMVEAVAKAGDQ